MSSAKSFLAGIVIGIVHASMAADYAVTVEAGVTNTVDDAFVTALGSADRLVKRGAGVLELNEKMASYAGEIVAEEGVLLAKVTGSFGTSAGATVVSNGASVFFNLASAQNFRDETFKISGDGAAGMDGAFVCRGASMSGSDSTGFRYITLLGDARLRSYGDTGLRAGTLNMNGHTLTIYERCTKYEDGTGGSDWQYAFSLGRTHLTNPGHIVMEAGKLLVSSKTFSDGTAVWDGDASNTFTLKRRARIVLSSTTTKIPWTLIVEDDYNTSLYTTGDMDTTDQNNAWQGPIVLKSNLSLSYAQQAKAAGSIWLWGPISGDYGLNWSGYTTVHLKGTNTFTGTVSAGGVGKASDNIPIRLHDGRALRPDGAGLVLGDSHLPLDAANAYELPTIAISNVSDRTVSGATAGGTMAALVKRGTGTLTYDTTVSVTGTLHVVAGTVTIPAVSARAQSGGVMEGTVLLSGSGDTTYWGDNSGSIRGPSVTERKDSTRYAYLGQQPLWADSYAGIRYTGYLWNDSETNETWSFMSGVQRRSKLFINGANVLSKCSWKCQLSFDTAVFGHATLKPGANKFDFYMEVSNGGNGGANKPTKACDYSGNWISAENFSWVANKCLAFNRYGTESLNEADYSKFEELADGSLMTITNDFSHLSPIAKASVGDLVVDAGATLDLSDADVTLPVRSFSGAGSVVNGGLSVSEKLVLSAAQLNSASPAISGVKLRLQSAVVIEVDDVGSLDRQRLQGNPYVVVASDTAFDTAPAVSSALAEKYWVSALSADGKSILLYRNRKGLSIFFK